MKTNLTGLTTESLEKLMVDIGEKPFRGRQLARWIYKKNCADFEKMTDISQPLRDKLAQLFTLNKLSEIESVRDDSGTRKTLWKLDDGESIESVLIPDESRLTLCLSTQVGCPLNCKFCATGKIGFKRNLTTGEIVNQYLQSPLGEAERITNIVFMGMGEPLLNFDNLLIALRILLDDNAIGFGAKKITVSTAGIPERIRNLADSGMKIGLAFSLNAATDELRNRLMPINRKYNLAENLEALKYYQSKIDRRITFEYILIRGVNDRIKDAANLVKLIKGIPCKINLIRYNPIDGRPFERPDEKDVIAFRDYLYPQTYAVTLRESKGTDITAACGQLKANYYNRR
ncbi:MAG: 23S rRNA (adenine(2503)-C(2))-methyltransferase RlmN [candidate division Zixibacteria bacterium]|nr:23S rRNA (adenine(2503)-C(2))-methyltransferase RlmN [candidate division Zixibacteria bacterium]